MATIDDTLAYSRKRQASERQSWLDKRARKGACRWCQSTGHLNSECPTPKGTLAERRRQCKEQALCHRCHTHICVTHEQIRQDGRCKRQVKACGYKECAQEGRIHSRPLCPRIYQQQEQPNQVIFMPIIQISKPVFFSSTKQVDWKDKRSSQRAPIPACGRENRSKPLDHKKMC